MTSSTSVRSALSLSPSRCHSIDCSTLQVLTMLRLYGRGAGCERRPRCGPAALRRRPCFGRHYRARRGRAFELALGFGGCTGPFGGWNRPVHGCNGAPSSLPAGSGDPVRRPARTAPTTALTPVRRCSRNRFGDRPSGRTDWRSGLMVGRKATACCCGLDRPASRSGARPGTKRTSDVSSAWWTWRGVFHNAPRPTRRWPTPTPG